MAGFLQGLGAPGLILVVLGVLLLTLVVVLGARWALANRAGEDEPPALRAEPIVHPAVSPEQRMLRLESRIRTLEDRYEQLKPMLERLTAAAAPRRTEPASPFASAAVEDRPRPESRPAASERAEPAAPPGPPPERVLADYRLALEDLGAAGERFIAAYQPHGLARRPGEDGYQIDGDAQSAVLWGVRAGDGLLLMPGYKAIKDWKSHFISQRERAATEQFGAAFELDDSSTRLAVEPAVAEERGGRVVVRRRGRITGFRS